MNRTPLIAAMFGAFALTGAAITAPAPASASEALPAAVAHQLDGQAAEFTMTAAKQRRLMIMQNMNRQQRYGRGGYGRGGYGGGGYGRGAPPSYYGRGPERRLGEPGRFTYQPGRGVRPY
ncbi:hypothetical protein [Bosea caraganae]|uniref:hypothetical protein n=1 Tax=Bosea caraganae TaxID=2763117 RepID=UPI0011C021EF|nr:hypothetical protein [Bosea caraganae]